MKLDCHSSIILSVRPAFLFTHLLLCASVLTGERKRLFNRERLRVRAMELTDRDDEIGKAKKCGCCEIEQQGCMGRETGRQIGK